MSLSETDARAARRRPYLPNLYHGDPVDIPRLAIGLAAPPAIAIAALHSRPFADLAAHRPGILALATLCLGAAMVLPQTRRWLLVALAYAGALHALQGAWKPPAGGWVERAPVLVLLYPWVWLMLLIAAMAAGTLEAVRPGAELAKRLAFGSAAGFMAGHGVIGYLEQPSLVSLLAVIVGVACLGVAVLWRVLIRAAEPHAEVDVPTADALMRERAAELAKAEWRER